MTNNNEALSGKTVNSEKKPQGLWIINDRGNLTASKVKPEWKTVPLGASRVRVIEYCAYQALEKKMAEATRLLNNIQSFFKRDGRPTPEIDKFLNPQATEESDK